MAILLMEKDQQTGYLNKELGSYSVEYDVSLIDRAYVVQEGGNRVVNMYLTVPGEFEDWEFNAILDNYDLELYGGKIMSIEEFEEGYNPTWLAKFNFEENDSLMEERINLVLSIHSNEIERVVNVIKELENEYKGQ